jgi:hypothetical protein
VAEWWSEADSKGGHPVLLGQVPAVVLQSLPLTAHSLILAVASDGRDGVGPSVPFVASDVGWLLAAAALILGIAVLLEAIARRRGRRSRTHVVHRRSDG